LIPVEEIVWAAAAAVVALVPPVRRRLLPVSRAVLSAGLGVGVAALRGVEGVLVAAACGDQSAGDGKTSADGTGAPAAAARPPATAAGTAKRPRRATAKAG
jgi:hypothetical protein